VGHVAAACGIHRLGSRACHLVRARVTFCARVLWRVCSLAGPSERCEVQALVNMTVFASEFATETNYDRLVIANSRYSGSSGPMALTMNAGDTLYWYSDGSVHNVGWTICQTPSPPSPTMPPFAPLPHEGGVILPVPQLFVCALQASHTGVVSRCWLAA
jgi:hypothetical protein